MPRQMPTTPGPRILRSSPRRKPPPSRSKSAAAVPDIDTPSRTVRPPFRLFDPFPAGLHRFQPNGFHGSRSYLRRHGVQFRRAQVFYQILRYKRKALRALGAAARSNRRVLASLRLSHIQQKASLSLPCLGIYHWLHTRASPTPASQDLSSCATAAPHTLR